MICLSDLVAAEDYGFVVHPEPWTHPGVLGDPEDPHCFDALVCSSASGPLVVCKGDVWDYLYACSHEIAEHQRGFKHTRETFEHQAIVLARWCRQLARENARLAAGVDNKETS